MDEKVFAQGRVNVVWVPAGGIADINAPTAAEINAGVALSEAIAWENYELAASESDDVDDRSILDLGNATSRGSAQFGGTLSFFRSKDPNDTTSAYVKAFEAFRVPRAYGYLVVRVLGNEPGKHSPFVAGDDISVYYFVADTFIDDTEGDDSVKFTVNFQPQGQLAVYTKVAGGTLDILPATLSLAPAARGKLTARQNAYDVSVGTVWTSSDTTVAKVSPRGVVTAVGAGTATITGYFGKTSNSDTAAVTVA